VSTQGLSEVFLSRLKSSADALHGRLSSDGLAVKLQVGHYSSRLLALCAYISIDDGSEEGSVDIMIEIKREVDRFPASIGIYRENGRIISEIPSIEASAENASFAAEVIMNGYDGLIDRQYGQIVSELAGPASLDGPAGASSSG
jgi:hypothetical protein